MTIRAALLLLAACAACAQTRYTADWESGVRATIGPGQGGELCGLQYQYCGQWVELLYKACDYGASEGWRGKAPLLWQAG